MSSVHERVSLLVASLLLASSVACKTREAEPSPAPAATSQPAVEAVDHLAPDELIEGPETAFGLPLPRGTVLQGNFAGKVYASHSASFEVLQKYFAPRLREVKTTWRSRGVSMDKVKVPSNPAITLSLSIDAYPSRAGSTIVIYDVTERPQPDLPDEEARWRAVGFTKDGKIADPIHYH